MAQTEHSTKAKRLYEHFLAPLVLGGSMTPGPAVGAAAAFALDGGLVAVDRSLRSHVDVVRVRVARSLVPVDTVAEVSAVDWALVAALHDLVHALHPGLDGVLHRSAPDRLLELAEQVIARVQAPTSLADAVSRHTFFSRTFEIQRTDALVSWWTGSRRFVGTEPSPRLLAWPELRRVRTERMTLRLGELPDAVHAGRREQFFRLMAAWLEKNPLTDLATAGRDTVTFRWTGVNLGLFAKPGGKTLGLRALALGAPALVDAALGRATAVHVKAAAWADVARIADVLAERAIVAASDGLRESARTTPVVTDGREAVDDAHYARVLGATTAVSRLGAEVAPPIARAVLAQMVPLAQSSLGLQVAEMLKKMPPNDVLRSAPGLPDR